MNIQIENILKKIGNKEAIRLFFSLLGEFITMLNIDSSSLKIAFTIPSNNKNAIHINLNGRLIFGINSKEEFLFMVYQSDLEAIESKITLNNIEKFAKSQNQSLLLYIDYQQFNKNVNLIKQLWIKNCLEYEPTQKSTTYKNSHLPDLYNLAVDQNQLEEYLTLISNSDYSILKLISNYKTHIEKEGIEDEKYKWKLLAKFKGKPSLQENKFLPELLKIDYSNLIYSAGIGVIRSLAKEKTKEYFKCFKYLFNEDIDLIDRIRYFNNETLKLYREIEPNEKLSHHHDERTIATLLTFYNPEKYTFYKNSVYQDYCMYLGIQPRNTGEKYLHYLELIEDIRINYILKDKELLNNIDNLLGDSDCYSDKNRLILSQDILYQMLTNLKLNNMSYYEELIRFLKQAKTNELKTSHYLKSYLGINVKVSFGQGGSAKIPWISFLRDDQTTQKGIYPCYLYYKDIDLLFLAYGISETTPPNVNWELNEHLSIDQYFKNNNLGVPYRYGSSNIFKVYNINDLPHKELINKDLNDIIYYYKKIILSPNEYIKKSNNNKNEIIQFKIDSFLGILSDSSLTYSNQLITRFTTSLLTKPFVILTGLSGSGKTKLAQAFAMWISENKSQYKIVPVGADWTNREPLLGFPNGLDAKQYVTPDSGALQLIIEATKTENQDKPYFLILDEMNLSHVERYFADFLSVMETKEKVMLYSGAERTSTDDTPIPAEISWPKNLFIVGTVNIDETTYMFSPKVLDRANVIEFRVTDSEMESYLSSAKQLDMDSLKAKGANMAADFVNIAKADSILNEDEAQINEALLTFFKELKKSGAEFGYRSASEILRFAGVARKIEPDWKIDTVIDVAVMQKLLPKVHGSRNKLSKILPVLAGFCLLNEYDKVKENYLEKFDEVDFENDVNIKYKLSFEKICRMYRNALENGYASYAEA